MEGQVRHEEHRLRLGDGVHAVVGRAESSIIMSLGGSLACVYAYHSLEPGVIAAVNATLKIAGVDASVSLSCS